MNESPTLTDTDTLHLMVQVFAFAEFTKFTGIICAKVHFFVSYWLGGRKGIRPVKTWGVVGMGSPLVLAGVASTGTVGALHLHYPPLAPQKSRTNNDGVL